MLVHNKKRKERKKRKEKKRKHYLCLKGLKEFDKEDTLILCQRNLYKAFHKPKKQNRLLLPIHVIVNITNLAQSEVTKQQTSDHVCEGVSTLGELSWESHPKCT